MSVVVVLDLGRRRVATKDLVDGEEILHATRTDDALVIGWAADLDVFDPPDEGAELLALKLGDVLRVHQDSRGILVAPDPGQLRPKDHYSSLVARLAASGRWIPNVANEDGATGRAVERSEIPFPDAPRSRGVELYVLSPARAMRELGLAEAPVRVVCNDRTTALEPTQVSAFYKPLLVAEGFATKRRVWSDGSAEQLVGHSSTHQVIVHAEKADDRTFVRVAWITKA